MLIGTVMNDIPGFMVVRFDSMTTNYLIRLAIGDLHAIYTGFAHSTFNFAVQ
jgi:hypothetical protein